MSTNPKQKHIVRDQKTGQQVGASYESADDAEKAKQDLLSENKKTTQDRPLEVKQVLEE